MDRLRTPDHRIVDVEVRLQGRDHEPLSRRPVRVSQRQHAFHFGCIGFELIPYANGETEGDDHETAQRLERRWFELFNAVTLPFYWGGFEPRRGAPDTDRIRAAAQFFADQGAVVKGHPLCWHTETAPWLLDLPVEEVRAVQLERIGREVEGFAGLIDTWDVVNEAVIMPVFDRYPNGITRLARELGRVDLLRQTFGAARAANPNAVLLLNDFDLSEDYARLIGDALDAGVPIDAIGIQSHMHQGYWGEEKTERILERYARFGLPLHWSESTIVSGDLMPAHIVDLNDWQVEAWPSTPEGEARQADEVARHYRTLFGHPAVAAITWWGLPDGGWLNAPSGFVHADGTPKPSFEALRSMIKGEWWLPTTELVADEAGLVSFSGTAGEYEIRTDDTMATIEVSVGPETQVVELRAQPADPSRGSMSEDAVSRSTGP
ncbi:MAG: endo-1,4-beta-xylanase [Candidatus Limnocylindrales bacterium]